VKKQAKQAKKTKIMLQGKEGIARKRKKTKTK